MIVVLFFAEHSFLYKRFTKLNYSTISLTKNNFSSSLISFIQEIFGRRPYRSLLARDFRANDSFPVDIYFYRPKGQEYSLFLNKGEALSSNKLSALWSQGIGHLEVRDQDFSELISYTLPRGMLKRSEELHYIRKQYKILLGEIFDDSKSDYRVRGEEIYQSILRITERLRSLINLFPAPLEALNELPFTDDSFLGHGINLCVYALVIGKELAKHSNNREDIVVALSVAAILHDVGKAYAYREYSHQQFSLYKTHLNAGLELIQQRKLPLTPLTSTIIREHHEQHNGLGYPEGISADKLCMEVNFFNIINNLDYFHRDALNQEHRPFIKSWEQFYIQETNCEWIKNKFNPQTLHTMKNLRTLN
ncbi:MAG: HD domain-containing protein [Oligoflexia bacterium]|nr:HD domain-containing protein [Oligoflexia bacterium]